MVIFFRPEMNNPDFDTAVGKLLDYVDLKHRKESFSKFEWEYPHNNKKLNPTTLAEAGFIRGNIKRSVSLPERDLFDPLVLGPEDDTVTVIFEKILTLFKEKKVFFFQVFYLRILFQNSIRIRRRRQTMDRTQAIKKLPIHM